jgi:hypothetical protein
MFVNNEIGVIQDIPGHGALCREKGIIFHVDAAQATGKVEIDVKKLPIDLMSLASHKTYGPQGHRRPVRVPQAAREARSADARRWPRARHALGHAAHAPGRRAWARLSASPRPRWAQDNAKARALQKRLSTGLKDVEQVFINGNLEHRVAQNLNMSFNFVEGESLIMGIKGLAGIVGLGLHVGFAGTQLRAASARPQRRTCAQQPAHDHRPLHDRGRNRLRHHHDQAERRAPARAQPAVGDVPGWDRHLDHPVDRSLRVNVIPGLTGIQEKTMAYSEKSR